MGLLGLYICAGYSASEGSYIEGGCYSHFLGTYVSFGVCWSGFYTDLGSSAHLGGSEGHNGPYYCASEYMSIHGGSGTSCELGMDLSLG